MRGCLSFIVFALLLVSALVWFGLPAAAGPIVEVSLATAGFQGTDTRVTVTTDPPYELLGLHADRLRIVSTDVRSGDIRIASVDVTLGEVGLLDRRVGTIEGRLAGLVATRPDGGTVAFESVTLAGRGAAPDATVIVARAEIERLVTAAVGGAIGIRPSRVALRAPNLIDITIGPATANGRFEVTAAGDLVVRVADGPLAAVGLVLVKKDDGNPFRFRVVLVRSTGLQLDGSLDPAAIGL